MQRLGVLLAALALVACGGDDGDGQGTQLTCVEMLPADCAPSIPATFPEIYSKILRPSCGVSGSGGSCHGSAALAGGLGLFDQMTAYDELLGKTDHARVLPGDAACSILMERLATSDPVQRMPLNGGALAEGELCAVQRWIEQGAPQQ